MVNRNASSQMAAMSLAVSACILMSAPTAGAQAQGQTDAQAPQQAPPAVAQPRVFASDAGLVLNFVKPDKAADFELVMSRLREALQKSENPDRRRQGQSWKIYRAVEPGAGGNVLFVFVIDPAVKNADYTVSTILAEAFPAEVQDLYRKFAESYASGQNIVNLTTIASATAQP